MIYVIPLSICLALHKYLIERGYKTALLPHHDGSDSGKRRIDKCINDDRTLLVGENDKVHVDYIRQKEYPMTFMSEYANGGIDRYTVNGNQTYFNLLTVATLADVAGKMEFKYKPSWVENPSRLGIVPHWTFTDWNSLGAIERRIIATANDWFPDRDRNMSVNVVFRNADDTYHTNKMDHDTDNTIKTAMVISATVFNSIPNISGDKVPAIDVVVRISV